MSGSRDPMEDLYRLRDLEFYRGTGYDADENELVASITAWLATLEPAKREGVIAWIDRQEDIGFARAPAQARIDRVLEVSGVTTARLEDRHRRRHRRGAASGRRVPQGS